MSLEGDFRALMTGDPAILALVSTRIYAATYPQGSSSPAIRYMKVSGATGVHMGGSDGLSESSMQVDARVAVADGVSAASVAESIRDAVVNRLHAFRGVEGSTDFRLIELSADRGISFDDTGPTKYYTASLEFTVFSRAAA